jgi:hypothetical protein
MDRIDHYSTSTWGSSNAAKKAREEELALVQAGKFSEAFEKAAREIEDSDPGKYTDALDQARETAKKTGLY